MLIPFFCRWFSPHEKESNCVCRIYGKITSLLWQTEELIVLAQFVLRFYYFIEDDINSLKKLMEIFSRNGLLPSSKNDPLATRQTEGVLYNLDYPQGKQKILAVRTSMNDDSWQTALDELKAREEEDILAGNDIMGSLTILCGTESWEEMTAKACAIIPDDIGETFKLRNGEMACLKRDRGKGEATYLCRLDHIESADLSFLSRRMPSFYAGVLRLNALDFVLNDRLISIRREKDEMHQDLIKILHAKLVMNKATLIEAEELEGEIRRLATAYGKLVGDQNLVVDGLKELETALLVMERQINADTALLLPAAVFAQMTESYQQRREDLRNMRDDLNEVQEDYRAAMDVVQSKIEVMNSRTNIATQEQIKGLLEVNTEMQKQGLVYQYAAGLIEFIVLAYYSHTLWSHLQHTAYTVIPSWIQFVMVMLFSGNIVWATHLIAEYRQGEHHVRKKLIAAMVLFLLLFALIIVGSILAGSHVTEH
jgi:hypothetical protein